MSSARNGDHQSRITSSASRLPLWLNIGVVAVTAVVVSLSWTLSARQSREAVSYESRFVTAEWQLLVAVKSRTERLLQSKDREIALLRQRYLEFDRSTDDAVALRRREELASLIDRAYAERQAILSDWLSIGTEEHGVAERPLSDAQEPEAIEDSREALEPSAEDSDGAEIVEVLPKLPSTESRSVWWYRQIIDDLRAEGPQTARARLEAADELPAGDITRLELLITLVQQYEELSEFQGEIEVALLRTDSQLAITEDALEQVTAELEKTEEEAALARERAADRLAELEGERARFEAELADQTAALRVVDGEIVSARTRIEGLEELLASEREQADADRRELAAQLVQAEAARQRFAEESTALEQRLALVSEQVDALKSRRNALETERDELEAEIGAYVELVALTAMQRFAAGREEGFAAALRQAQQLLDYLAGVDLADPSQARERLVEAAGANESFRELVFRANRLGVEGTAAERGDLPQPRLVGIITSVEEDLLIAEAITSTEIEPGDRVDIRSREGVQPGELLGSAELIARVDTLLQLRVTQPAPESQWVRNDLVYVTDELPERPEIAE